MNSPKRPIITCASSERLTPSHACQSPETAFFRGPCRPSPLQQQRQQHQNILFPLLRFTRVHQPAGSYRADLCGPINLHVGNILFYMIKMRKDRTKRKNTMHERFTKYKVFRKKLVSVHSLAPLLTNLAIFYSRPFRPTDLPWQ